MLINQHLICLFISVDKIIFHQDISDIVLYYIETKQLKEVTKVIVKGARLILLTGRCLIKTYAVHIKMKSGVLRTDRTAIYACKNQQNSLIFNQKRLKITKAVLVFINCCLFFHIKIA